MIKGTVSDWKYQAKFGFIKSPEFEGEIFFHIDFTVDNQPLTIGDTVTFRLSRDDKGRRIAVDVLHNSIATALDPTLDIAEGTFPVASAIDVWVRDPPAVSSLPARGA